MTTLGKRIESLEKQSTSEEPGVCTVFVGVGEDVDQKQAQGVAAFVAENGHPPSLVSVVQFVDPPRKREKD
ncbi:MAG: hypothetical protein PWQ61_1597 [Betaproteobacteria bacterium]|nr:hypothetical protein [Betaproteobacteria bacterium]